MTKAVEVVQELQRRHASDWEGSSILDDEIFAWAGGSADGEMELYDAVAAELARGYSEKRYSFSFCDAVVNELYVLMIAKQAQDPAPPWPKLFWRVFEAFDAGESSNPSLPSYDPIRTETDPLIAEIVSQL